MQENDFNVESTVKIVDYLSVIRLIDKLYQLHF